jgi:hypothetical protein
MSSLRKIKIVEYKFFVRTPNKGTTVHANSPRPVAGWVALAEQSR